MIGRNIQVGIGKESSRGSAVAPTYWLPKYDATVDDKREYVNDEQSLGVIADTDNSVIVREYAEGELSGKVSDKSFGLFLLAGLGSVSSVESADTGVYNHTFSLLNTNLHPSLTIEVKNDLEQLAFPLAVLQNLSVSAEVGKFVEYNGSFMSKKGAVASNTPSYSSENEFISKNVSLRVADDLASLDGASDIAVRSVEISLEKNVEEDMKLGSLEPAEIYNKQFTVEGNIEATFNDIATFKALFTGGSTKALRFKIEDTGVTIGTTSNPGMVFEMPKVSFQEWERAGGNDELITQTIKFKAHYDIGESKMLDVVLTNEATSY